MRLFIAIRFDEKFLNALSIFQENLRAAGLRGHFTPPENLHLTLAFLGEYGNPETVRDAMASFPFAPFPLRLEGMGRFSDLYWAGLAESAPLGAVAKRLRRALAGRAIPYDRKRFSPHITVVRQARFSGETELPVAPSPTGEMTVKAISLMRSERGRHGMVYTEIGEVLAK